MNTSEIARIVTALTPPHSERSLAAFRAVCQVETIADVPHITLTLPFPVAAIAAELEQKIQAALREHGIEPVRISFQAAIATHKVKAGLQTLPGVKNIIAVASGKGGVGKSTTTANLAIALAQSGARVGVLDADLYGPSQPAMFAIATEKPEQRNKQFIPIVKNGIQIMSIGLMVDAGQSLVWRGPLISQALQQLFFQTAWDEVDYLLVDLPPGTGDIQLTLTQKMPVTGAVVVTTPQDIALLDARKAIDMFHKTGIPVFGILENMSQHICSHCGHAEAIFGTDGGKELAASLNVQLLGQLPLSINIRQAMDAGDPFSLARSKETYAAIYRDAAQQLTYALAASGKDYSHTFPQMVIKK
ncbi:MAG: iron-sulfur cluster carrier protein ApbC [Neisseria sp.]|nr:iron-sulfur cluster carrier protein ApbC [Neisseria sp.]